MMANIPTPVRALYTAEATAEGGREGHARTGDGRLDVDLAIPTEMGGPGGAGTNPEQLFAAGYAACFQSALAAVARREKLSVESSKVTARVGIGPIGEGRYGLTVQLVVDLPSVPDRAAAELLVAKAHEVCPYSNATRGNIIVELAVA
jgi:osmotically inducible protein OsmC